LAEYEEIKSRDEFLSQELLDLERSAVSLKDLIKQLEDKIDTDFKNGILKINEELERFFKLMFAGGRAELGVIDDGIDITVNLPKKRITSLDMLSGGERALTSIALLFAMSQVNPPPFLILDETDAALDESNSRKYAKLLKDLSKNTQLVLVTHNRETMEVAQILYGVTMDGSGISRLLSIKLEEAGSLC
jgi:chromosome segregation protein